MSNQRRKRCVCSGVRQECGALDDGWSCTKEKGHSGRHVACGGRHYIHSWPKVTDPATGDEKDYCTSVAQAALAGWLNPYMGTHGRIYARKPGNHRVFRATAIIE